MTESESDQIGKGVYKITEGVGAPEAVIISTKSKQPKPKGNSMIAKKELGRFNLKELAEFRTNNPKISKKLLWQLLKKEYWNLVHSILQDWPFKKEAWSNLVRQWNLQLFLRRELDKIRVAKRETRNSEIWVELSREEDRFQSQLWENQRENLNYCILGFIKIMLSVPELGQEAWELVKLQRPEPKHWDEAWLLFIQNPSNLRQQIWEFWFKPYGPVEYLLKLMDRGSFGDLADQAWEAFLSEVINIFDNEFEYESIREWNTQRFEKGGNEVQYNTSPLYRSKCLLLEAVRDCPDFRELAWKKFKRLSRQIFSSWEHSTCDMRYIQELEELAEQIPSLQEDVKSLIRRAEARTKKLPSPWLGSHNSERWTGGH